MSDPYTFYEGEVPTVGQWNQAFNNLQNNLGFTPVSTGGQVMTGLLTTTASTATIAGFNIVPGINSITPNPGDLWTTATGLFINIAGQTIQLAGGTSGYVGNISALNGTQIWLGNNFFTGSVTFTGTVTALNQQNPTIPQGRLTILASTPIVTPSNGTTSQTLYYAPYNGSMLPLYNGITILNWVFTSSSTDTVGLSLSLGGNSTWAANTVYDVFAVNTGSALALATGPAWINSTTRLVNLGYIYGILTNASSMNAQINASTAIFISANKATYLGTIKTDTNTAGQISFIYGGTASGGSAAILNVYNYYNRINIGTVVTDNNTAYNYSSSTIRPADNSTTNRVSFVQGVLEDSAFVSYQSYSNPTSEVGPTRIGVGLDSISTFSAFSSNLAVFPNVITMYYSVPIQIGSHFIQALESTATSSNTLFVGNGTTTPFNNLSFNLNM